MSKVDIPRVIRVLQRGLTGKVVGQCNSPRLKMARAIEKALKELKGSP